MVLAVYFALSLVIGLVCHHRRRISSANLTPTIEASGPHDFAVRKLARSSVAPPASIASRPYVRDDRETPLCVGGMAADIEVIWVRRERKYFCEKDWTTQIRLKLKVNFSSARMTSTGYPGGLAQSVIRHWCRLAKERWRITPSAQSALRTTALLFIEHAFVFFVMAGLRPGHPRLSCLSSAKTWMPGTSPGTTSLAANQCGLISVSVIHRSTNGNGGIRNRYSTRTAGQTLMAGLTRPNRSDGRSWRKGRAPGDRTFARSPGACVRARTSGSRPGCLNRWRRSASTGHSRIP
jgi:hypothetical protein